ncbi:MAG: Holliday junction resolvase RuvX [Ignavibacteriales bacterium]|nr:Holliday junction resolvase RuvX [Ignavibacteriales bacterium]
MEEKRILAIDYGEKRIGIAITDPLNMFAYPLTTLENDSKFMAKMKEIVNEYNVVNIIVGNPLKESGEKSRIAEMIKNFTEEIKNHLGLPVELVDERYSSEIAKQRIIESVPSKKKRRDKTLLDKNAAAVLLEDYLRQN